MFDSARSMEELMSSNEPLLPELCSYVVETDIGAYIKHPLIVMSIVSNALINEKYKFMKQKEIERPYSIAIYERPFRLIKLVEFWHNKNFNDTQLCEELAWVWPDMEGDDSLNDIFIKDEVLPLFKHLGYVSDQDDLYRPESSLLIYRGGLPNGIAWSESLKTAKWFASRFEENNPVYCATVEPKNILARFKGRNEDEIIVDPRSLDNIELIENGHTKTELSRRQAIVNLIYNVSNHRP